MKPNDDASSSDTSPQTSSSVEQMKQIIKELQFMTIDQQIEIERLQGRIKTLEQRLGQILTLANLE